ncbi:MAG: ethanolamine utilization protein EutN [Actinobacteria bacterium]|nr:ethanolamine utilization protein EutN [Actinomycetota bacterium]
MFYAKVIGNVVATIKYKGLIGKKLQIIQPVNLSTGRKTGEPLIAVDSTDSGIGDFIGYEDGMEATWPFEGNDVPSDATIVSIIEKVNVYKLDKVSQE